MEDFVTFELAKRLKEKGFRYNTSYWYNQFGNLLNKDENDRKSKNSVLTNDKSYGVDAPTITQVLKWLRKEKHLHINIEYVFSEDTLWICEVQILESYGRFYPDDGFDTYEQAVFAGIEYVLDNLI